MHGSVSLRWLDGSCVEEGGGDDEKQERTAEEQGKWKGPLQDHALVWKGPFQLQCVCGAVLW